MKKYDLGLYEVRIFKTKEPEVRSKKTGKPISLETLLEFEPQLKDHKLIRKCEYCSNFFISNTKRKYCSEDCYTENKRYMELNRRTKEELRIKHQNARIKEEHLNNYGYLPEGFNQIDDPKRLGEVDIHGGLTPDENGEYDWDKEAKFIGKLKRDLYKDNYINE